MPVGCFQLEKLGRGNVHVEKSNSSHHAQHRPADLKSAFSLVFSVLLISPSHFCDLPGFAPICFFTSLPPSGPAGSEMKNSARRVRGETFHLCVSALHYVARHSRKRDFPPVDHTFSNRRLIKTKQEGGDTANVDGL